MAAYALSWITKGLAVGRAPLSNQDLREIRAEGISVIVNVCAEYCDLHEIEAANGFQVYYLPVVDGGVPPMEEMDQALGWLDAALSRGEKALVHCRFGIGRTGTFVTAYLFQKGYRSREIRRLLKRSGAGATNFSQWWFLRLYRKRKRGTARSQVLS